MIDEEQFKSDFQILNYDELSEKYNINHWAIHKLRTKLNLPKKKKIQRAKPLTDIEKYIKLHHRKPHNWLQEHIKLKYGELINLSTIRSTKRKLGKYTDKRYIHKEAVEFTRRRWQIMDDQTIAERFSNKIGREITHYLIYAIRKKHHWLKGQKRGLTVKEVRICPQCGKKIKITCKHPNQKFCSRECVHKFQKLKTNKRDNENLEKSEIYEYYTKYKSFAKSVINRRKMNLSYEDCEEIFNDYLLLIPNIIYHIKRQNINNEINKKNYIAVAILNLIRKKFKKVIPINENETPLIGYSKNRKSDEYTVDKSDKIQYMRYKST